MNNKQNNLNDAEEIASSLKLAIAQIDMSMRESDQSVQQLIESITAMTGCLNHISVSINEHNNSNESSTLEDIHKQSSIANQHMQNAVQAFQFYDRMSQRFAHIEENLHAIAELIMKPEQQHPELWRNLQKKLRSVYSTEQEQTMYQALMNGISEADVMQQPLLSSNQQATGEIELF